MLLLQAQHFPKWCLLPHKYRIWAKIPTAFMTMGAFTSSLCTPCKSICSSQSSLDRLFSSEGYKDHVSIPELQKYAKGGCPLCRMLSDARYLSSDKPVIAQIYEDPSSFRRNRKIMLRGRRTHESLMSGHNRGDLAEIELWVDIMSPYNDVLLKSAELVLRYSTREQAEECLRKTKKLKHSWLKLMTLKAVVQRDISHGKCGGRERVLSDPDSPHAWSHVKEWLGECAEHAECKVSEPPELPRRLIAVGDGSEPLRLIEKNGLKGEYVALSYCWGGPQKLVTNKSTIDAHLLKVDQKSLPKTIQDAINVTRQLDFQYLWVDVLCIVHDSVEDKMVEMAKMHQYYRHASLTIVAASAAKAQEGFLRSQTAPSCTIPYFTDDDKKAVVRLEHMVDDPDSYGDDSSGSVRIRNPISSRAWTLQENILSPRKLTYGTQRIDWQCCHHRASMSGDGVQKDARSKTTERDPPDFDFFAADHHPSKATIVQSWASVVANYSSRFLTEPEDKLPAISGIAQAFQRDTGWTYLAGLWAQSSFALDLLWYTDRNDPKRFEPESATAKTYRAPSWSWAAIDGRIHMAEADVQLQVSKLVSYRVCLQDTRAPFGQVRQGSYIEVSGPMKRIDRAIDFLEPATPYFMFDRSPESGAGGSFLWLCSRDYRLLPDDEDHGPGMGDAMRSLLQASDREDVQAMLRDDEIEREEFKNMKPMAAGLILVPVAGAADVYQRIGVFLALPQEFFDNVEEPSSIRII